MKGRSWDTGMVKRWISLRSGRVPAGILAAGVRPAARPRSASRHRASTPAALLGLGPLVLLEGDRAELVELSP